jgi:hypothetical protein
VLSLSPRPVTAAPLEACLCDAGPKCLGFSLNVRNPGRVRPQGPSLAGAYQGHSLSISHNTGQEPQDGPHRAQGAGAPGFPFPWPAGWPAGRIIEPGRHPGPGLEPWRRAARKLRPAAPRGFLPRLRGTRKQNASWASAKVLIIQGCPSDIAVPERTQASRPAARETILRTMRGAPKPESVAAVHASPEGPRTRRSSGTDAGFNSPAPHPFSSSLEAFRA